MAEIQVQVPLRVYETETNFKGLFCLQDECTILAKLAEIFLALTRKEDDVPVLHPTGQTPVGTDP